MESTRGGLRYDLSALALLGGLESDFYGRCTSGFPKTHGTIESKDQQPTLSLTGNYWREGKIQHDLVLSCSMAICKTPAAPSEHQQMIGAKLTNECLSPTNIPK